MNFSEEVKATLWNLIDKMSTDLSGFVVHPDKDFTRKKKKEEMGFSNDDKIYHINGKSIHKK